MKADFTASELQTARRIVAELAGDDPSQAIAVLRELKDATSPAATPT